MKGPTRTEPAGMRRHTVRIPFKGLLSAGELAIYKATIEHTVGRKVLTRHRRRGRKSTLLIKRLTTEERATLMELFTNA